MVFLAFTQHFSLPLTNPVLIFSLILFIILFAPLVLNRLNIPHLIGLIIAGILIGPHGFNLMNRDSSIILFGTVGLLYIMFLAGLEIDMEEFLKNKWKSIYFGLLTFSIPMLLGTYGALYLLGFRQSSAILLASMFASHTLLAYPIISKMGLARNKIVGIAIGGTMITDTLALMVLAIIVGVSHGTVDATFWWRLGISFTIATIVILIGFPILARWFLKKYSDNISQYIFILALVFLGGFMAELAGLEAIIGAFMAGLSLNKLIPRTSSLMNRIEFVGNALFIPFFLIGVGMLINVSAFFSDWVTIKVAAFMVSVALAAKYLAAWITQKTLGFSIDHRRVLFGLSSAQAAATLAAVLVGYNTILNAEEIRLGQLAGIVVEPVRLLDDSVLNATILMILVTCTVASFQAQKGASNLALSEENGEEPDKKDSGERILFMVDPEAASEEAVNFSLVLKSRLNQSDLYALTVITPDMDSTAETKARRHLEQTAKTAAAADVFVNTLLRYDTNLLNGVVNVIRENDISDLLFILKKEGTLKESFLASITDTRLSETFSTIYIYRPVQPIATIRRHLVMVPDKAEKEPGFFLWLGKIWNIGRNTGAQLVFYASGNTLRFLKAIHKKHPVAIEFKTFDDWDDFLIISRDTQPNDNLIVVMSRRDMTSYSGAMNKVPLYLNKYFSNLSFLLVYPIQKLGATGSENPYNNPAMIETFHTLDDLTKSLLGLFRRK